MVEHRTHEEFVTCNNQVAHKLQMMQFTSIGVGCILATPFAPALVGVGLLAGAIIYLAKAHKKTQHADNTHKLFMALHNTKDITSPEYKELSAISKEFDNIESLSVAKIKERATRIRELSEVKEQPILAPTQEKHLKLK